ncbi:MAG: pilus assembly PilX N-terminal domain-containing protein [Colwellia sp.]|nr:pilus assembly PilX N-terminal domain-containing protein [Colwellia sp.]
MVTQLLTSNNLTCSINKQKGVVLIVSLVFLIALTAVAAALMQNTTTDMRMSGASEEKAVAEQEIVSAIDEYIFSQVTAAMGNNGFAEPIATFKDEDGNPIDKLIDFGVGGDLPISNKSGAGYIDSATLGLANNQFMQEADCPHSKSASSAQVFTCNVLRIQISRKYGRHGTSTVEVNSGVAQQLLK